jgi:hypothetical protein
MESILEDFEPTNVMSPVKLTLCKVLERTTPNAFVRPNEPLETMRVRQFSNYLPKSYLTLT